jgi:hypothetical protein
MWWCSARRGQRLSDAESVNRALRALADIVRRQRATATAADAAANARRGD